MIPYQGCKQKIAKHLLAQMPAAENFYDLFGGGGSMTEAALDFRDVSQAWDGSVYKWQNIHYNELNTGVVELNKAIWSGTFDFDKAMKTWISRERFFKEKDLSTAWGAFVRFCWSYNTGGEEYLYGKPIEVAKKLMHILVHHQYEFYPNATPHQMYLFFKSIIRQYEKQVKPLNRSVSLYLSEINSFRNRTPNQVTGQWGICKTTGRGYKISIDDKLRNFNFQPCYPTLEQAIIARDEYVIDYIRRLKEKLSEAELFHYEKKKQSIFNIDTTDTDATLENLLDMQHLLHLLTLKKSPTLLTKDYPHLHITNADYQQVKILPNSIVYCDIPYDTPAAKGCYGITFNHQAFFDWASSRDFPVYFSEYNCDDNRFQCIYSIEKQKCMGRVKGKSRGGQNTERLYWNGK